MTPEKPRHDGDALDIAVAVMRERNPTQLIFRNHVAAAIDAYLAASPATAALGTQEEMAAFGASDYACYKYPEHDQAKERAAFCEGAAHQATSQAFGTQEGKVLGTYNCPICNRAFPHGSDMHVYDENLLVELMREASIFARRIIRLKAPEEERSCTDFLYNIERLFTGTSDNLSLLIAHASEGACADHKALSECTASQARTIEALRAAAEPFAKAWVLIASQQQLAERLSLAQIAELACHELSGADFQRVARALKEHPNG